MRPASPGRWRWNRDSTRAIEASVSADLAVHTVLAGCEGPYLERVHHGGALPELQRKKINLYVADPAHSPVVEVLAGLIRRAYAHARRAGTRQGQA